MVESLSAQSEAPLPANPPPWPEHKRVWASLTKGKAAVVDKVAAEVLRRAPQDRKTHVALTDGERPLQILVNQKLQVTLILDLLRVLEKLWKAAYVFHAEGSAAGCTAPKPMLGRKAPLCCLEPAASAATGRPITTKDV